MHSSIRYALQSLQVVIGDLGRQPVAQDLTDRVVDGNLISVPFMSNVTNFGLTSNPMRSSWYRPERPLPSGRLSTIRVSSSTVNNH